jgi:serine/threonine protein phosphatase 1
MNTQSPIYAIGDIHGSLAKLTTLIARCEQHAGGRSTTFVFLGDYIDRGPDSAGVIRTLMSLQSRPQTRVIALKGNHEALSLEAVDGAARRGQPCG